MEDGSLILDNTDTFFVGVAASAGGLEAASLLVQNLPISANAVYVLAQHMSPTHKSLLSALISRETKLPVVELVDRVKPDPDTIYVTPPNADVVLENGILVLRDPEGHSATPKPSGDRLFKSLAAECGERCVAIVLSGTGSDGSYGVQAVREAGGITIAQDTSSAKYDGMPTSAIETGCVDLTLTPEQMGQHLNKILATPRDFESLKKVNAAPSRISDLLQILLVRTQVDFREYKENTIHRRISRRMVALGIDDYDDYVDFCRTSEEEVEALHRDLLISVTRFFRDPTQFDQLQETIADLVEHRDNRQIRVWVAGCATGEEAYSIAVLVADSLGGLEMLKKTNVQIFASDIDERALEIGRRGVYPSSAAADIPKRLLDRYFEFNGGNIQVIPAVRNIVLFSRHNVAQDPPFINVDLVTLRNILIYFNAGLQERVLRRVHYSLNQHGLLFLGTSEAVGSMQQYFELRLGTDKIFKKRQTKSVPALNFAESKTQFSGRGAPQNTRSLVPSEVTAPDLFEALARSVAPVGFLVTKSDQIVRIFGDISNVIELTEQSALNMSTRILMPGLRDEASSLITITLKTGQRRAGRWHTFKTADHDRVRLVGYPISQPTIGEDQVLFALEFRADKEDVPQLDRLSDEDRVKYVRQIEQEMMSTREALQQTVEELQTSNEELQSVNEELQSTNEELQATNEELETSNEELQSTNEELITVNEEMQVNASELQRVTIELSSIVKYAPYPILIVDQALMIRRMSDKAKSFYKIDDIPTNGLHVAQVAVPNGFPMLAGICSDAFRERTPKSTMIETGNRIFSLLVTPFFSAQEPVLGLKITVVELEVGSFYAMADVMDKIGKIGHWRLNVADETVYWSDEVYRIHGLDPTQTRPKLSEAIKYYHPDDRDRVERVVKDASDRQTPYVFEARVVRPDGTTVPVRSSGTPVVGTHGDTEFLVGALLDLGKPPT